MQWAKRTEWEKKPTAKPMIKALTFRAVVCVWMSGREGVIKRARVNAKTVKTKNAMCKWASFTIRNTYLVEIAFSINQSNCWVVLKFHCGSLQYIFGIFLSFAGSTQFTSIVSIHTACKLRPPQNIYLIALSENLDKNMHTEKTIQWNQMKLERKFP